MTLYMLGSLVDYFHTGHPVCVSSLDQSAFVSVQTFRARSLFMTMSDPYIATELEQKALHPNWKLAANQLERSVHCRWVPRQQQCTIESSIHIRGPNHQKRKTRTAQFCCTFRVLRTAHVSQRGSRTRSTFLKRTLKIKCKSGSLSARFVFTPQGRDSSDSVIPKVLARWDATCTALAISRTLPTLSLQLTYAQKHSAWRDPPSVQVPPIGHGHLFAAVQKVVVPPRVSLDLQIVAADWIFFDIQSEGFWARWALVG